MHATAKAASDQRRRLQDLAHDGPVVQPEEIEALVHEALPDARVQATDTTGGGDHWHVVVVDDAFEGLLPIKRQRLVMEPFKPHLATDRVHALDLVTVTPQEAEKRGIPGPTGATDRPTP